MFCSSSQYKNIREQLTDLLQGRSPGKIPGKMFHLAKMPWNHAPREKVDPPLWFLPFLPFPMTLLKLPN